MDGDSLEDILCDVAKEVGYHRGVFLVLDSRDGIATNVAITGVPKQDKEIEIKGNTGKGFYRFEVRNHPFYKILSKTDFFHTCLKENYRRDEVSAETGPDKEDYYPVLARQLEQNREKRFDELSRLDIFSPEYDFEAFCLDQNMNFSKFRSENWGFDRMYPSFAYWSATSDNERDSHLELLEKKGIDVDGLEGSTLYGLLKEVDPHFNDLFGDYEDYVSIAPLFMKHYGVSLAHYSNTFAVKLFSGDDFLVMAQFDSSSSGEDPTVPLSLEKQREALEKLKPYVPSIIMETGLKLVKGDLGDLAEKYFDQVLGMDVSEGAVKLVDGKGFIAKSDVYFPGAEIAEGSERAVALPNLFCIKRLSEAGAARKEAAVRKKLGDLGFRTYTEIGATDHYLISRLVPSLTLDDFLIKLGDVDYGGELKKELLEVTRRHVDKLRRRFPASRSSQTLSHPDYVAKFKEGLVRFLPVEFHELAGRVAIRYGSGLDSGEVEVKYDKHLPNLPFAICDLAIGLGYDDEFVKRLAEMTSESWENDVNEFFQDAKNKIEEDVQGFLNIFESALIEDDQDTYEVGTYIADNDVMLVGSYGWGLPVSEVVNLLPESISVGEWAYRSAREIFNAEKFKTPETKDYFEAKQKHHYGLLCYLAESSGDSEFVELMKLFSLD